MCLWRAEPSPTAAPTNRLRRRTRVKSLTNHVIPRLDIFHRQLDVPSLSRRQLYALISSLLNNLIMAVSSDTLELSIPVPHSLDTRIYIRLSTQAKAIMLFLTTATADELSSPKPMGSFVYALPDVCSRCAIPGLISQCKLTRPRDSTLSSPSPRRSSHLNLL